MESPRKGYKTKRNRQIVELHDLQKESFHQIAKRFKINQSIAYRAYWGEKIRQGAVKKDVPKGMKKYYEYLFIKK